jgi:hypothetical protein
MELEAGNGRPAYELIEHRVLTTALGSDIAGVPVDLIGPDGSRQAFGHRRRSSAQIHSNPGDMAQPRPGAPKIPGVTDR